MRVFFWIILAAMLANDAVMLFWSLPHLSALADGLLMFDLRLGGYSFIEAEAVLKALGPDGRQYYLSVQQALDTAYPALLAGVLVLALYRVFASLWAGLFSAFALAGACFDYLENAAVAVMLRAGESVAFRPEMVDAASGWTILKSIADGVALMAVLLGLALVVWRRMQTRRQMR